MNSDSGVVPDKPWPRSLFPDCEEEVGGVSSESSSASRGSEEGDAVPGGQSVDARRDSNIVSSGASKNASR